LTSVLLNQLPLPDLPETLTTSFVFLPRVHPITENSTSVTINLLRIGSVAVRVNKGSYWITHCYTQSQVQYGDIAV
jgi:hypothetical protein